jgi:general secretion pathway protein G
MSYKIKQSGFTLIEVMVVVAILAILASVLVPRIMDEPDKARVARAKQDIRALESALDLYKLDNLNYPSDLQALVEAPADAKNWKKGGYIKRLPKDPWGEDYQYANPGTKSEIDIFSFGADKSEGGEGLDKDIGNWPEQ